MARFVLHAVLVVVVCGLGWGCAPSEQTVMPRRVEAPPPKAPALPVAKSAVKSKSKPKPLPTTGCRKLLDSYRQMVSRIPYPASLPYRPLLGMGEKIVKRMSGPDDDPVCQAQLRHIMTPLMGQRTGPGLGKPPTLPKAQKE